MNSRVLMQRVTADYMATIDEIQDVWALVSENPLASVRSIARQLFMPRTKVHYILKFLEGTGYIRHNPRSTGRTVVIPLQAKRAT